MIFFVNLCLRPRIFLYGVISYKEANMQRCNVCNLCCVLCLLIADSVHIVWQPSPDSNKLAQINVGKRRRKLKTPNQTELAQQVVNFLVDKQII